VEAFAGQRAAQRLQQLARDLVRQSALDDDDLRAPHARRAMRRQPRR
jgi:hypothetical protein